MTPLCLRAAVWAAALFSIAPRLAVSQAPNLKNAANFSLALLNSNSSDHYIGVSVFYVRYLTRVVAVKADAAYYPETMASSGPYGGGKTSSASSTAMIGWRGARFSLLGEAGGGVTAPVAAGGSDIHGIVFFTTRHYPSAIIGGFAEKSITGRLSLTYEVRDDWTFLGANTESIGGLTFNFPPLRKHELAVRGGLTIHF